MATRSVGYITLYDSADQKPVMYYKLGATQPATPTSLADLSTWSTTPPTPTSALACWACAVYLDSLGVFVSANAPGVSSGPVGPTGDYFETRFQRAATAPAVPTGDTPSGWLLSLAAFDGNPGWSTTGKKNSAGTLIGTWGAVAKITGEGTVSAILSNEAHVFTAALDGTVSVYTGSGTLVRVYEGAAELTYDGTGTANGTWKVTTAPTNITVGSLTDSGAYLTVGQHSGVAAGTDVSSIVYTITGKSAGGVAFTLTKTQSFSKSKVGATGATGTPGSASFGYTCVGVSTFVGGTYKNSTTGGYGWNPNRMYTTDSGSRVRVSGVFGVGDGMIGLASSPQTSTTWTDWDTVIYNDGAGLFYIGLFGTWIASAISFSAGTVFTIEYDGFKFTYYVNGVLYTIQDLAGKSSLRGLFDSTSANGTITNIGFSIRAPAPNEWTPVLAGAVAFSGDKFFKGGGNNLTWDGQVYSLEGYKACVASWIPKGTTYVMCGLSTHPTYNASYSIPGGAFNYFWYSEGSGNLSIYENGAGVTSHGTYDDTTVLSIIYDGVSIRYLKNGIVMRTTTQADLTLYLDSTFYAITTNGIRAVSFGKYFSAMQIDVTELFAQEITISEGGYIQSSDYAANPTTAGFRINADGSAVFNDVAVRGEFSGQLDIFNISTPSISAGTNIVKSKNPVMTFTPSTQHSTYEEMVSLDIAAAGTIRVAFTAKRGTEAEYVRIYINGVAAGTARYLSGTYTTYTEDLTVTFGARISLHGAWAGAYTDYVYIKNFTLGISVAPGMLSMLGN